MITNNGVTLEKDKTTEKISSLLGLDIVDKLREGKVSILDQDSR